MVVTTPLQEWAKDALEADWHPMYGEVDAATVLEILLALAKAVEDERTKE